MLLPAVACPSRMSLGATLLWASWCPRVQPLCGVRLAGTGWTLSVCIFTLPDEASFLVHYPLATSRAWAALLHFLWSDLVLIDLWNEKSGSWLSCPTLHDPMDYTVHGILQARILELGSRSLLQGVFPTQGLNPRVLHCWRIFSQPRNRSRVSCTAGGVFASWLSGKPCIALRASFTLASRQRCVLWSFPPDLWADALNSTCSIFWWVNPWTWLDLFILFFTVSVFLFQLWVTHPSLSPGS